MNNLVINAGPGSGKTFTIIETYNFIMNGGQIAGFTPTQEQFDIFCHIRNLAGTVRPHEILFLAFNKGIQQFMEQRLPAKTKVYTFNGLGQSLIIKRWGYKKLDRYRGQYILRKLVGEHIWDSWNMQQRISANNMLTYIGHLKEELLPICEDSLIQISEKYGITDIPRDIELISAIMKEMQQVEKYDCIEYKDQVWLGLQAIRSPQFKLALVDEAQDLSALRLEFALRIAEKVVFCGDPYQSINAFAGADYAAFEKLRGVSDTELPLKTCFRCTPNRIQRVNEIRPARIKPNKSVSGPEERLTLNDLPRRIQEFASFHYNESPTESTNNSVPRDLPQSASDLNNYLIMARTNAQLVKIGLVLSGAKVPCKIVKRDEEEAIETILLNFLKQLRPLNIADLINKLQLQIKQAESLPERASMVQDDKCRSLLALAESCTSIPEIKQKLQSLTQQSHGAVNLATIHRSKGLEAPFVFLLIPVRHPKARSPNQIEQETNLEFVAESRSSYYHCYVTN